MAKNRSRWWLALLALGVLVVLGLVLRGLRSPSGDATAASASDESAGPGSRSHRGSAAAPGSVSEEPDEESPSDGLSLLGRVVYPDGRPADGAAVRLLARPSGAPRASMARRVARSDPDGSFAFAKQAQGDYLLEAQTDDAASPTTPVRLVPGSKPVTLMLFPGATLAIRVVSAVDEKPIAGATVKVGIGDGLFGASDAYRQEMTDAGGIARFRGISPVSNHPVFAVADGFAGTYDNIRAFEHLLLEWEIVLALQPGGQVAGRVVDERRVPIAGAKVGWEPGKGEPEGSYTFVTPLADGGHYIAAVTDAAGAFRKSVPPGVGCLVAVHPRHLTGQACGLRAEIGRPLSGVEIVMKSGARLSGVVVTPDGKPVARAEVIVTQPDWDHVPRFSDSYRSRTTTDADGRFAFEGVDRQPLALTAWTDEGSSELVELDLRGVDERKDVRITVTNVGVIAGSVTEEDGRPAPYALVNYFITPSAERIANVPVLREYALPKSLGGALSDGEGRFRITGLPPGSYALRATRPAPTSVAPDYSGVYKYDVATGSTVTLVLPGMGALAGRVVTDDGRPVPSFTVAFAIWEPAMETAVLPPGRPVASADGSFQIDEVPANRYAVAISTPGPGPQIVEWRKPGGVQLRSGRVTNLGTIRVNAGRAIAGRVLSPRGDPVRGAHVVMAAADRPDQLQHAQSDDAGRFTLPAVARGIACKVRASNEQGASDWLVVPPGAERVDIVLSGAARGGVKGVIVDPAHPVAERLVLLTLPGRGTPGEGLKPEVLTHALDGGRFVLENVPAGQYVLWVRRAQGKGGDEWASRQIAVESMKETSVLIDLSVERQP